MKKLGEQWVEIIDGKEHMVEKGQGINCLGCCFGFNNNGCKKLKCPVSVGEVVKDLGILNEDGLLPCPFCGEYPEVHHYKRQFGTFYGVNHSCRGVEIHFYGDRQEVIDRANRRA